MQLQQQSTIDTWRYAQQCHSKRIQNSQKCLITKQNRVDKRSTHQQMHKVLLIDYLTRAIVDETLQLELECVFWQAKQTKKSMLVQLIHAIIHQLSSIDHRSSFIASVTWHRAFGSTALRRASSTAFSICDLILYPCIQMF